MPDRNNASNNCNDNEGDDDSRFAAFLPSISETAERPSPFTGTHHRSRVDSSTSSYSYQTHATHHSTTGSQPWDPLLPSVDESYSFPNPNPDNENMPDSVPPPRPSNPLAAAAGNRSSSSAAAAFYAQPPHQEQVVYRRGKRRRRWFTARLWTVLKTVLAMVIAAWAAYTTVRYFVAFAVYPDPVRRAVNVSLGSASALALVLTSLVLILSARRVSSHHHSPSPSRLPLPILRYATSFLILSPAIINLALIFVWRTPRSGVSTELSLAGRCHWDIDVSWVGVGGQCTSLGKSHPSWDVWLAAAVGRLGVTLAVVIAYLVSSHLSDAARARSRSALASIAEEDVGGVSDKPYPAETGEHAAQPRRSPPASASSAASPSGRPLWERRLGSGSGSPSASSPPPPILSSRSRSRSQSQEQERAPFFEAVEAGGGGGDEEGGLGSDDLQSFADRFRVLVGQVSYDIQRGMRLSPPSSPSSPSAAPSPASSSALMSTTTRPAPTSPPPPLPPTSTLNPAAARPPPQIHRVLDTHTPYASLDEFGRAVILEETISVFGRAVRRMPTIESMGSRAETSTPTSAAPVTPGTPSIASVISFNGSRPPTRQTNREYNPSASASQTPSLSRSSSTHTHPTPPSRSNSLRAHSQAQAAATAPPRLVADIGGGDAGGSGGGSNGGGVGSGMGMGMGMGRRYAATSPAAISVTPATASGRMSPASLSERMSPVSGRMSPGSGQLLAPVSELEHDREAGHLRGGAAPPTPTSPVSGFGSEGDVDGVDAESPVVYAERARYTDSPVNESSVSVFGEGGGGSTAMRSRSSPVVV